MVRCSWAGNDALLIQYHDEEWGVPEHDSRALWETLMLEGFQAGLSWVTILRKRDAFRAAFNNFIPEQVARFNDSDIDRLLTNAGIVRSRAKIEGTIAGARAYLAMQQAGDDFARFAWSAVEGQPVQSDDPLATKTALSEQLSKQLKQRGFKFVGPVIVYAWMQAVGLVNSHSSDCFRRRLLEHKSKR